MVSKQVNSTAIEHKTSWCLLHFLGHFTEQTVARRVACSGERFLFKGWRTLCYCLHNQELDCCDIKSKSHHTDGLATDGLATDE